MKIIITGASGFIGSHLVEKLGSAGHEVIRFVRRQTADPRAVFWDPRKNIVDSKALAGADAIINLSGENISSARWSKKNKELIVSSRKQSTELLARVIGQLENPPKVFISASAIGIYGDRGDEVLTESSHAGSGFLAELCQNWESLADQAASDRTRVVKLRIGLVFDPKGGALKKMLPAFRLGLGGRLGDGAQYMSWTTLNDFSEAVLYLLSKNELSGVFNLVSPGAVTNADFTNALAKVLKRPAFFHIPAWILRTLFGELADALLLSSARVNPTRLLQSGFSFKDSDLEATLRKLLFIR